MRNHREAQPQSPRNQRIAELERNRVLMIEYARMKLAGEDWHGVQDAASDLRDIDNELDGLNYDGGSR